MMFIELTDLKDKKFLLNKGNIIDISLPSIIDSNYHLAKEPGASIVTVDKRRYVCQEKYEDIKKWMLSN